MHKKITQLANGTFDYEEQGLSFSIDRITLEITEGKPYFGEFLIQSDYGKKLRGIVYSSNPRMECLTPQFEGEKNRIQYQFHSEGLTEGDVRKGEFLVVCEQGEFKLSFDVSVSKAYAKTSVGKIKNISDFVRLARESFAEAYQVFYSINFSYLLEKVDERERILYEGIRKEPPSMQAIEAYLVGIGRKPAVHVALEEEKRVFLEIKAAQKDRLYLKKDHWGYAACDVKTDVSFLCFRKNQIVPEDFIGSICFFEYEIDVTALHAGKNYGKILFEFPEYTLACEICVERAAELIEVQSLFSGKMLADHLRYQVYQKELLQYYLDYRTQKVTSGTWVRKSLELLEHLLEQDGENVLYRLMKAQVFLVDSQRQEAEKILEEYKCSVTAYNTPEWGYYLYLCTLLEREEGCVNRLAGKIEEIFRLHPDNPLLFLVRLFVREEYYKNSARRLKAIEAWIKKGSHSPVFYLEAFYLYWKNPYLLTHLEIFEIKVLHWAAKQDVISKEIAVRILELLPMVRCYDEKLVWILEACYEVADKKKTVAALCGYLIKGQRFGKKYHKWYALGMEHGVRITNLYEAYLLSADQNSLEQMPKAIFLYFQYHSTLPFQPLSMLYAYMIQKKEKYKKEYQNYYKAMERFAIEQIKAGRIDENMAVIYRELLSPAMLDTELAEKLSDILFVHKLRVTGEKKFARVIILQKQWKRPQIVPVADGKAYFSICTDEYGILLQDTKGQLFADTGFYEEEALLEADMYLDMVMQLAPMQIFYLVYFFERKQKRNDFSVSDWEYFSVLMDSKEVSERWKAQLQPAFMQCLMAEPFHYTMKKCLKNVNADYMSVDDRVFILEQMIENQMPDQAYELLQLYGYDMLGRTYLAAVCSYKIAALDYEEDEFLLDLANEIFKQGERQEILLNYLCRYYHGPTKHMADIWKAAKKRRIETFELEERILTQMLYSADYIEDAEEIYEAYYKKGSSDLIDMAYLSYFSWLYLVKDAAVSKQVFVQLEHRILLHQEIGEVQGYALLKYYAECDALTEAQLQIADRLLAESLCRHVIFAFYQKLDEYLVRKYGLHDRVFIQYHTKPGIHVRISYYQNEEALKEEAMTEMYDGIFVKSFVLFYGEKLSYYITEINEQKERSVTESVLLEKTDTGKYESSRYALLNQMLLEAALQNDEKVEHMMKSYHDKVYETEALFHIL